jgi:hypothetical protein
MKQVLLYSKYSQSCDQLLSAMERLGAKISMVCLDNKEVRERVMKDSRLKITVVPTLLSLYDSGIVEKYEGPKVLELLLQSFQGKTQEQSATSSLKVELTPLEESSDRVELTPLEESSDRVELTSLEDLGTEQEPPNFADRMTLQVAKQEPPKKIEKIPNETGRTDILDLDSEEPTEESVVGIESTGGDGSQNLPIKASSGVAAAAAKMAKEREQHQAAIPRGENNIRPSN